MRTYTYNICKCPGCTKPALSEIDKNLALTQNPGWCIEHHPYLKKALKRIFLHVMRNDTIIGLTACGVEVKKLNLRNKRFIGCNLQNCTLTNVHADGLKMRICIADNSTLTDCDFVKSDIQFSSFAGSKFVHILFTGSNLIHTNFNGLTSYQSSFDDSDLYNTRFIKTVLINNSFRNCNLKKTVFYDSVRDNVSFKLSNTREALVDRKRGGLMGDIGINYSDGTSQELL